MVKYDNVALALQLLRQAQASTHAYLIVVGADEEEALAGGRIGIHRDHWNAGGDRLVDAVFEQRGIGHA
jgi:hypothetical protein